MRESCDLYVGGYGCMKKLLLLYCIVILHISGHEMGVLQSLEKHVTVSVTHQKQSHHSGSTSLSGFDMYFCLATWGSRRVNLTSNQTDICKCQYTRLDLRVNNVVIYKKIKELAEHITILFIFITNLYETF